MACSASYIIDGRGTAIISTQPPGVDDPKVSVRDLAEAQHSVYIDLGDPNGRVTALVKLQSLSDAYLLVDARGRSQGVGLLQAHHQHGQRIQSPER